VACSTASTPRNGIPSNDPHIAAPFSADDISAKAVCKASLQKQLGLPVRPNVPLFGVVGRLTPQKGFDVLAHALDKILAWDLQMVLLGNGDPEAEHFFSHLAARAQRQVPHLHRLRRGTGASDRSRSGLLAHAIALRALRAESDVQPALRHLAHRARNRRTCSTRWSNYDQATGNGTGFIFWDLTPGAIADTVGWALSTYFERPAHIEAMRKRAMQQDFSWDRAAEAYEGSTARPYQIRRGHPFP
jgi:starch synthase